MNAQELQEIIRCGEIGRTQFKQTFNDDALAAEMIALSNAKGGVILVGVQDKTGEIFGLDYAQLQAANNRLATIANDKVKPQIFIFTEVVTIATADGDKRVLVISVAEGVAKPYKDKNGVIWVKQGADKRRLTDNNETMRLFQESGMLHIDELPVPNSSEKDIAVWQVQEYLQKFYKDDAVENPDRYLYENLGIMRDDRLTLGGLLFFGRNPQRYYAAFCIKAVALVGDELAGSEYRDSKDIVGTIPQLYEDGMRFFDSNLLHLQNGQNFNSEGTLEISYIALAECLQNALLHRDYTCNAPIRLFIFEHRIELISPGRLPNNLTVEKIKLGQAAPRNNLLVNYGAKLMPCRGGGSGVHRAVKAQPNIEFINDEIRDLFIVKIPRPKK